MFLIMILPKAAERSNQIIVLPYTFKNDTNRIPHKKILLAETFYPVQ